MSRPAPADEIVRALARLIDDVRKPYREALIKRLRGHQYKYAMEDGELYRDLQEAIEMLKGGPHA
jgi:hypothetical protein